MGRVTEVLGYINSEKKVNVREITHINLDKVLLKKLNSARKRVFQYRNKMKSNEKKETTKKD